MRDQVYDLCILGGGINGAGIARDAAGRGLSVLLLEAEDLGSATSSASTKLIHGGLRYLEHYAFRLVRESLQERERLLGIAPHIIWPLEFILPYSKNIGRPYWLLKLGLFLYDNLALGKTIPGSKSVRFPSGGSHANSLSPDFEKGFSYYDCWVDDSRLVVLNAVDAAAHGADVQTYTQCISLTEEKGIWHVIVRDGEDERETAVRAKKLVNACGPWAQEILEKSASTDIEPPALRLVKGSHIIIDRAYEGEHAYILQQPDQRIVFAIPYEEKFTLIGTTDVEYEGDARPVMISDEEIDYLCAAYNRAFQHKISPADVIWTYSGVRSLIDDGKEKTSSVTRDYSLIRSGRDEAPMLSVYGGKLTTYRVLSRKAVDELFGKEPGKGWTASKPLPGGEICDDGFERFYERALEKYGFLPASLARRYCRSYGIRIEQVLKNVNAMEDLGENFGGDLYEREVAYLIRHEFARKPEDVLWRRTKRGLHMSELQRDQFGAWFGSLYDSIKREEAE